MPHPVRPVYAENSLDRMDQLRPSIHERLFAGPDQGNRFVLISEAGIVLRRDDRRYAFADTELAEVAHDKGQAVFLGARDQEFYFALAVEPGPYASFEPVGLRELANQGLLPDADLGLLAQANSVAQWHGAHRFCGSCGGQTAPAHGGWRRDCASCGRQHFPRIDPVVIMLVTHGDLCLLGAGRNFKISGMYACLAGFMEPGETVEDAARRELAEEAGVAAGRVSYMFSQPWPFPYSLMLGLHVEAQSLDVTMYEKELADLKWVSRDEVRAVLKGATDCGFLLPPRGAIARNQLEAWAAQSG